MSDYYESLGMTMFPPGSHPTIGWLRQNVPLIIKQKVDEALRHQREKAFPELEKERKWLEAARKQLADEQVAHNAKTKADYARYEQWLKESKAKTEELARVELRLTALLQCFDDYAAYFTGAGAINEGGKRLDALLAAYKTFKGSKS